MTDEEKIELYFFDHLKTRDEYIEFYKKLNPEIVAKENNKYRYSPMFYCFKDVKYCFGLGREFNNIRSHPDFNPAYYAGIMLLAICNDMITKKCFSNPEDFLTQYSEIESKELVWAIRLLRNALEHNQYSLSVVDKSRDGKPNVGFSVGLFPDLIKRVDDDKDSSSEYYFVNQRKLYSAFEKGIRKLKDDLLSNENPGARRKFLKNFSFEGWIITGP